MVARLVAIAFVALLEAQGAAAPAEAAKQDAASDSVKAENAKPDARVPVLVELFTSEGCSSCPPADAVLARLLRTQPVAGVELIGLSEHVDYWNYLGWRDPWSAELFTQRQERYEPVFGRSNVYTPQVVVGGRQETLGSDEEAVRSAVERAASDARGRIVLRAVAGKDAVSVRVGASALPAHGDAEVLVGVVEDGLVSEVARGENAGRTLPHTAVVRALRSVPLPAGATAAVEQQLPLEAAWRRESLRVVAFVQERTSRRVLAAAQARPAP